MKRNLQSWREEIIWAAGLMDGEGYFGCVRNTRYPHAQLSCNMTHRYPILRLKELFGGSCYKLKRRPNPVWKQVYMWILYGQKAQAATAMMYQFLTVKRKDAERVLAFPTRGTDLCDKGHGLWGSNLIIRNNCKGKEVHWRVCRICADAARRAGRARRKNA